MLKSWLYVVMMISVNVSFAKGPVIKAGPCVHLNDPTSCVNYPRGNAFGIMQIKDVKIATIMKIGAL